MEQLLLFFTDVLNFCKAQLAIAVDHTHPLVLGPSDPDMECLLLASCSSYMYLPLVNIRSLSVLFFVVSYSYWQLLVKLPCALIQVILYLGS